ncbi:peroxiredoxin family protein [Demequina sp. SO4-13]|uniref:peroxiredoxin family protein n=1 Tax=Demequina sp. SO4-13 TaxID=3401027 RepID=UPI003AF6E19C
MGTKPKSSSKKQTAADKRAEDRRTAMITWASFLAVPAVIAVLVGITITSEEDETTLTAAPDFTLTTTAGEQVSLDESLADGDTLLYFSMGLGCDGCFAQIPELDDVLAERDIEMLSIMVDPPEPVAAEEERFGVTQPILIDPDAQVSADYGMIGIYGHGDRPSHSFALVNQEGEVEWVRHYAEMFVEADAFVEELDAAVKG